MKLYFILSTCFFSPLIFAKAAEPTAQQIKNVEACYTTYPFLLTSLHEVSDHDFMDDEKSMQRISVLKDTSKKSSKKILQCVDQILLVASLETSPESITLARLRLSEVRILLLLEKISERNLAKK